MSGYYIIPKIEFTGGTVSGNTVFLSDLSANTIYYNNTPIQNVFAASGSNIGSGTVEVFADKNNGLLEFKTILPGNNIDVQQTVDTITIQYTGANLCFEDGVNTYTSMTSNGCIAINVTGLTIDNLLVSGNTNIWNLSAYTLSANTIYSGTTPIQNIFPYSGTNVGLGTAEVFSQKNNDLLEFRTLSAGTNIDIDQINDTIVFSFTGNTIPSIENGINTFTANTLGGISINVTGLTVDNLVSSGLTNIWNLSSTTISASTFYSGTTPLTSIFPYSGTNIGLGTTGIFAQKNNDLLEFKTLSAGTRIVVTGTSDTVVISTSGINNYYIQTTAPSGTTGYPLYDGDRWFNTTDGIECVWMTDPLSSQWVEIITSITGTNISNGTVNYIGKFDSNTTLTDTATPMVEGANGIVVGALSIDQSAIFELNSSSLGFLPPRMTEAQLNSISNPAIGLMIYQTDGVEGLYIFKSDNTWHLIG